MEERGPSEAFLLPGQSPVWTDAGGGFPLLHWEERARVRRVPAA
jgi:hypothetical protein